MKLLRFPLIIFFIFNLSQVFAQWQIISSGTTANLVDGCFVNDSTGFVISSGGKVFKTIDQGTSWQSAASLTGVFTSICSSGPDTVYAGGNCIYRSTDRGVTWNLVKSFTFTISDLIFFRGGTGFITIPGYTTCTWNGTTTYISNYVVDKTVDGGVTWTYAFSPGDPGSNFDVVNDHTAFITGGGHSIVAHCAGPWYEASRKTMDKGTSWGYFRQLDYGGSVISFINESTGYYVRDADKIYKTTDGGYAITGYYTEKPAGTGQCLFINEIDGYLLSNHAIYSTKSKGVAWNNEFVSSDTLNYLFKNPSNILFCVGTNGLILKKHLITSTSPEQVYRIRSSKNPVYFGNLSIDSSSVIPVTLTNTGNQQLDLTLKVSNPYGISFINDAFGDSLHASMDQQTDTVVFVRFRPTHHGSYPDTLKISSPGLSPVKIPLTGFSYSPLVNNILSDTVICSDTLLIGANITVMDTAKMTICAGTQVIILGNYNLNIRGILDAKGDSLYPIRIESPDPAVPWQGITFANPAAADTSVLRYCIMTSSCYNSVLTVNSGIVRVDNCTISSPHMYSTAPGGITLLGDLTRQPILIITNSKIFGIYGIAVSCNMFNPSVIENNEIFNNNYGIQASGNNGLLVKKNHIHHNLYTGIYGSGVTEIMGNNIHNNGGGIDWTSDGSIVENNVIYNNGPLTAGGLFLTVNDGVNMIAQNLIYNNSNKSYGAGMLVNLNYSDSPAPLIINNTICNNKVGNGLKGNEFCAWSGGGTARKIRMYNNIIYNLSDTNNIFLHSNVIGELGFNSIRQKDADTLGQNTITAGPALVFPTGSAGVMLNLGSYSWALLSNSPCINAGNNDVVSNLPDLDIAGNPRVTQNRVDIGAYEYPFPFNVDDKKADVPFEVYPNPADDILHVTVKKNLPARIVIYDLTTRMVLQANFIGHISLNTSQLAPGIYLYKLSVNESISIGGKIVKK